MQPQPQLSTATVSTATLSIGTRKRACHVCVTTLPSLQVATGRQLLEEGDALLHGLRRHGVLRAASNETLLVVYGPQHTMRYRTLLLACALGNVHALFLPLYHNLEAALVRLLRQQWPAGAAQPRVAVLARLALPR